jgi:hypothetical protein
LAKSSRGGPGEALVEAVLKALYRRRDGGESASDAGWVTFLTAPKIAATIVVNNSRRRFMSRTLLTVRQDGDIAQFNGSWYRGPSTNFIPNKRRVREESGFDRFIIKGWSPDKPFISKAHTITSFGSCFAIHITKYLAERGYSVPIKNPRISDSYVVTFGEGLVNTFAIRQQIEWGFGEKQFDDQLWFGRNREVVGVDANVRRATEVLFHDTDVFIFTLGLSEIWYNKENGEALWGSVPSDIYDEETFGFRVSTVEENRDNLVAIRKIIRKHRPNAKIIVTLSPVPLMATFRPVSCLTASSVSKAILRVAIDEFMRELPEEQDDTYYFPSYEGILNCFDDPFEADNRHPKQQHISAVLGKFMDHYCLQE